MEKLIKRGDHGSCRGPEHGPLASGACPAGAGQSAASPLLMLMAV